MSLKISIWQVFHQAVTKEEELKNTTQYTVYAKFPYSAEITLPLLSDNMCL